MVFLATPFWANPVGGICDSWPLAEQLLCSGVCRAHGRYVGEGWGSAESTTPRWALWHPYDRLKKKTW